MAKGGIRGLWERTAAPMPGHAEPGQREPREDRPRTRPPRGQRVDRFARPFVKLADVIARGGRQLEQASGWTVSVYALVDPRDDTVRYIGVTNRGLMQRLRDHVAHPTNHLMRRWIAELTARGEGGPRIVRLSYVQPARWQVVEMDWISWCRARGQLFNVDPGGAYRDRNGKPRKLMQYVKQIFKANARRQLHRDPTNSPRAASQITQSGAGEERPPGAGPDQGHGSVTRTP